MNFGQREKKKLLFLVNEKKRYLVKSLAVEIIFLNFLLHMQMSLRIKENFELNSVLWAGDWMLLLKK